MFQTDAFALINDNITSCAAGRRELEEFFSLTALNVLKLLGEARCQTWTLGGSARRDCTCFCAKTVQAFSDYYSKVTVQAGVTCGDLVHFAHVNSVRVTRHSPAVPALLRPPTTPRDYKCSPNKHHNEAVFLRPDALRNAAEPRPPTTFCCFFFFLGTSR